MDQEKNCLYLHLGTPKTGTTALQAYLTANKETLKEQGFIYPEDRLVYREQIRSSDAVASSEKMEYVNGSWIVAALKETIRKKSSLPLEYPTLSDLPEGLFGTEPLMASGIWRENLALTDALLEKGNVIYSNEWLWKYFRFFLKPLYAHYGDRLHIVIYLRRQDCLVESLWNEAVSSSSHFTLPFEGFVNYLCHSARGRDEISYRKSLDYISQFIDSDHLIVRIYKKPGENGQKFDIGKDLMAALGIDAAKMKPAVSKNERIRGQAVEYVRVLNELLLKMGAKDCFSDSKREKMIGLLHKMESSRQEDHYFTPEGRAKLLKSVEEDLAYVSKVYLHGETLSDEGVTADTLPTIRRMTDSELESMKYMLITMLSLFGS